MREWWRWISDAQCLTAESALERPVSLSPKRMRFLRVRSAPWRRGAELTARVGTMLPFLVALGQPPPCGTWLSPVFILLLVFSPYSVGLLCLAHIQGGIITLQTKHVLLSLQERLSAETSCGLLCSSWLRILVNCSHRGWHFLPEGPMSSP